MLRLPYPFYMVRHGETDWNVEGRFQGRTDIPINETGRMQASQNGRRLAQLLGDTADAHEFYSSPLGRTRETMERLRAAMGLEPGDYRLDDALLEVTFGAWERQTLADISVSFPALVAERDKDKWTFVPPSGESYADAARRLQPFLESLSGPSVIVTHGGIIRAMRYLIEDADGHEAAMTPVPQDNIYHYDGIAGGWL